MHKIVCTKVFVYTRLLLEVIIAAFLSISCTQSVAYIERLQTRHFQLNLKKCTCCKHSLRLESIKDK